MVINEKKIKIVGVANIPKELELGNVVDLTISDVDIDSSQDNDNYDSTFDRTFKLKISEKSEINIISEKEIIRAKKKGGQSKLLRWEIQKIWEREGEEGDFEDFYTSKMTEIINNIKNEEV